jgi:hypothetical protein
MHTVINYITFFLVHAKNKKLKDKHEVVTILDKTFYSGVFWRNWLFHYESKPFKMKKSV